MRFPVYLALIALLSYSPLAKAADAGCGLGSMIISKNAIIPQLLAMTTNHMFFTQELGITSGTSGCSSSSLVMNDKEVQYFAEVNQEDLSREMAQGQGEKLTTLAALYGCDVKGQELFAKMLQSSYGRILPSSETGTVEMVQNINRELQARPDVAHSCHTVSSL